MEIVKGPCEEECWVKNKNSYSSQNYGHKTWSRGNIEQARENGIDSIQGNENPLNYQVPPVTHRREGRYPSQQ
ncbi:hypothetical protein NQ314_006763 [Rhamnusium bicolor]|uniref:Uncharacterized protein n=1 Tax=Rhamnusium bicolor TaxID=1586634 RepID=A0AAV8YXB9_9CUCU|nr:hypothetical protein NQ314_006763 [Rhamnusium bicolor]